MREIKFRAWDKINGVMICFDKPWICEEYSSICLSSSQYEGIGMLPGSYNNLKEDIAHYEIMQYTGLKDKNGVEIWDGDVVSFTVFDIFDNDTQYTGCIVYCGSRFMIWNKPDDELYGNDGGFDLDWVVMQDDEFEVIGNIHENSELLDN